MLHVDGGDAGAGGINMEAFLCRFLCFLLFLFSISVPICWDVLEIPLVLVIHYLLVLRELTREVPGACLIYPVAIGTE